MIKNDNQRRQTALTMAVQKTFESCNISSMSKIHLEERAFTPNPGELGAIHRFMHRITNGDPTLQGPRDRLFFWPAVALNWLQLSPNSVSIIGLSFAVAAAFCMSNPLLASCLILLNLLFDGFDGVLARKFKRCTSAGEVVDIVCDTISLLAIALGLWFAEFVNVEVFAIYSISLVVYTYTNAVNSKRAINIYRSVGARVFTSVSIFFGFVSIYYNIGDFEIHRGVFNSIFSVLSVIFVLTVLINRLQSAPRH